MTGPKATGAGKAGTPSLEAAGTKATAARPARAGSKASESSATASKVAGTTATGSKAAATKPTAAKASPEITSSAAAEGVVRTGIELYLLRHADAGDPAKWTGDDADRRLSSKGSRQAKRLGRHLKRVELRLDTVITSPKLRAAETARPVARSIGADLTTDARLGFGFGSEELAAVLAGLAADARGVMLVGHDPDFSELASWLLGATIEMRKGALARIDLPDRSVRAGRGSLRWLLPPDAVSG